MAKAKKTKRKSRAIVQGHLERINSQVFDNYRDQITELIGKNHGVYALYRRNKLYYIGLAADLKGRIRTHLKDRHKGKWDHFSLYIIRKEDHIREVESLLARIAKPPGNKQMGKLGRSRNLLPFLKQIVTSKVKHDIEFLFGTPKELQKRKKRKVRKTKGHRAKRPLKGLFPTGKMIYRKYKGKDYKAWISGNGKIKYNGKWYDSPSVVGSVVRGGKSTNGWRFWKYKNKSGELVYLSELTKSSTPTAAGQ